MCTELCYVHVFATHKNDQEGGRGDNDPTAPAPDLPPSLSKRITREPMYTYLSDITVRGAAVFFFFLRFHHTAAVAGACFARVCYGDGRRIADNQCCSLDEVSDNDIVVFFAAGRERVLATPLNLL